MMKKITGLVVAGVAVFALSGCGGGTTDVVYVDEGNDFITLLIVDHGGVGMDGVPYECVNSFGESFEDFTRVGEFTFEPGSTCTFDLFGFGDPETGATPPLFIVDIDRVGKKDIPYYCENDHGEFTDDWTDIDGLFRYPIDAYCEFDF